MTEQSLQINFSLAGGRPVDPYWLRMEMVKNDDTQMTVGEAAGIIDALYDVSICGRTDDEPQTIEEQEQPTADDWRAALARLRYPSCEALAAAEDDMGAYDAQIKVYRSHQGELYKMLLSAGDIRSVVRTEERVTLTLDIEEKSYITLDVPIVHSPVIAWQGVDGPDIRIIGNTLYWDEVFTGVLRAEFNTIYDLVDVHVHGITNEDSEIVSGSSGDGRWLGTGWYSGDEDGTELLDVKDIECAVLAFYHYQFETITLHKPEIDESVPIDDIMAICEWTGSTTVPGDGDFGRDGECFKAVKSIEICECGGKRTTTRKEIKTGCPPGVNKGTTVNKGKEEAGGFDFVDCGGDDEVSSAAFYEKTCCEEISDDHEDFLPKCKERHSRYTGNCIPDHEWLKKAYGNDAQIIMVGAKHGVCGELIVTQDTSGADCCDGVSALSWDTENSGDIVTPGSTSGVAVLGGKLPLEVSIRGAGFYLDPDLTVRDGTVDGRSIMIFASPDACGYANISVADGCSKTSGGIKSTEGQWNSVDLDIAKHCGEATGYTGSDETREYYRDKNQYRTEQYHPATVYAYCLYCWQSSNQNQICVEAIDMDTMGQPCLPDNTNYRADVSGDGEWDRCMSPHGSLAKEWVCAQ